MFGKYRKSRKPHETIASIVAWQEEVFPDASLSKQLEKYQDEREEYLATIKHKERIAEMADLFIVACNVSRFSSYAALECFGDIEWLMKVDGVSRHKLARAIDEKMAINRRRKWNSLGGKYQHKDEQ